MVSKYFELTTKNEKFNTELNNLLKSLEGQRILLYGAGQSFWGIKKKHDFSELNIIAIADEKFEKSSKAITPYKQITPSGLKYKKIFLF